MPDAASANSGRPDSNPSSFTSAPAWAATVPSGLTRAAKTGAPWMPARPRRTPSASGVSSPFFMASRTDLSTVALVAASTSSAAACVSAPLTALTDWVDIASNGGMTRSYRALVPRSRTSTPATTSTTTVSQSRSCNPMLFPSPSQPPESYGVPSSLGKPEGGTAIRMEASLMDTSTTLSAETVASMKTSP